MPSMQPFNICMQSIAIDVLQANLARDEVDKIVLESIEAIAIAKLYFSIHTNRPDLQNKWLHLWHSIISLSTSHLEISHHAAVGAQEPALDTLREKATDQTIRYSMNPRLIQTLVDGISTQSNRAVLQHWLDFVLLAIPQFQPSLLAVVGPLNECLCHRSPSSYTLYLGFSSRYFDAVQGDHVEYSSTPHHKPQNQACSAVVRSPPPLYKITSDHSRLVRVFLYYTMSGFFSVLEKRSKDLFLMMLLSSIVLIYKGTHCYAVLGV